MKIAKRQLRRIIREALSTEVPDIRPRRKSSFQVRKEKELAAKKSQGVSKSKRILSTDPASTKIYAVRYADDMVGMYAGHEATGGNDPEVQAAAQKAGVEIKPGSGRGRNFDVIGNKHSLAKFDQEYRAATKPIRDAITREHGTHLERWRKVTAARDAAPGGNWREMESRQKRAWRAGRLAEVPPVLLSNAYSEEELARVSPPDLKYAMKLRDD